MKKNFTMYSKLKHVLSQVVRHPKKALICLGCLLLSLQSSAQTANITGKVTDEFGAGLPGVTVMVKGETVGTATDVDGNYSLRNIANDAILVFSFIGYLSEEVAVGNRSAIDISLVPDIKSLDELVVIGYGSVKKSDLTGAVASVKGEDLVLNNPVSVNQGLQGMIAGVEVNQNDGAPGAGISMTIRGANSFNGSEPLYVVDGIPVVSAGMSGDAGNSADDAKQTINPLAFLNPQDIESIQVLKDASSTAIYGSRGSNGVVLITTKKGKPGKERIEFNARVSVSSILNKMEMMGAHDYALRMNESRANTHIYEGGAMSVPFPGALKEDPVTNEITYVPSPEEFLTGVPAGSLTYPEGFTGTDWLGTILREAVSQDYSVRISGGDDKGTYSISGNYADQQGIIKNSGFKRYGAQFNLRRAPSKLFEFGLNTNVTFANYQLVKTNTVQTQSSLLNSALLYPSIYPFSDPFSERREELAAQQRLSNPYNVVKHVKDETESTRLYMTGHGQVNFTPFLNLRQRFGYNYHSNFRENYMGRKVHQGRPPINGRASEGEVVVKQLSMESLLSFNKEFGEHHSVNSVVAFTYEDATEKIYEIRARDFPTDLNENFDIGSGLIQDKPKNRLTGYALMGFLGRVNYAYKGKYLFTANFRRDGSSKFIEANKWANFGSVAFAWNAGEEQFVRNLNVFSQLKLRTSYGSTGNQAISPYSTKYQMRSVNAPLLDGVESGFALNKGIIVDPDLKWETTYQADIGLDMGFMKDRLSLTVDVYHKRTEDLLQSMTAAPSTGFQTKVTNFGTVINKGLELSVYGLAVKTSSFSWSVNGNIAFNRNEIQNLEDEQFRRLYSGMESAIILRNGHSIGTIYGMVEDGFYDNEAEVRADPRYAELSDDQLLSKVGEIKYVNVDGDEEGVISASEDRTIIGNTTPDYTFGITNTLAYKNFTFSFFFQGAVGNDILNTNSLNIRMGEKNNFPKFAFDGRWTPETAATATWPRLTSGSSREMFFSDRHVEDGSFVRLKTINLAYNFSPASFVSDIQIYGSVNNVLTFSNYSWFDPDVNSFASDPARRGVDMNAYPSSRTFTLGVRASF